MVGSKSELRTVVLVSSKALFVIAACASESS
jgi:hypothetical protein